MTRVVIVDESPADRDNIRRALASDRGIEVVGQTGRVEEALSLVESLRPDVITLGTHVAGGGGRHVIEQVMAFVPTPILVLSRHVFGPESEAAVEALVAGAVDALPKPDVWDAAAVRALCDHVRIIQGVTVVRHVRGRLDKGRAASRMPRAKETPDIGTPIVAIGASTGGPAALATILAGLGGIPAAVLVVQHLHEDFVDGFVTWMGRASAIPVQLAEDGERTRPGRAYIAPGRTHLKIGSAGRIVLDPEPATLHRPSVDQLFHSLADRTLGRKIGVLLTGIGDDGAAGLLELRKRGAVTIAQDESSSAVYGMPGAAARLGAVSWVLGLEDIAATIMRSL